MSISNERAIDLSKIKITLIIVGSFLFVILGVWLASLDDVVIRELHRYNNPTFVHAVGNVCVLFFSACCLFGFVKFFDKKPGLVLSSTGIVDNSSGVAAGFIPWTEITGVSIYELGRQKMLIVKVRDPSKYINRGSPLKRALNRANNSMCGSPIVIGANALKINFDELLNLFNSYRQ